MTNVGSTARKIFFHTFLRGAKFKDRSYTSQINQEMILKQKIKFDSRIEFSFRDESFNYLLRAQARVQVLIELMVMYFEMY